MAAVYGSISEFNLELDDARTSWEEYCERMSQYFIANGLKVEESAAQCKAIFLSSVGAETYSLMKTLCLPAKPENKSLAALQKLVKDHLSPAPIIIAERYVFYNRKQQPNESAAEFLKELRRLAGTCEFHEYYRNDVIRDMFVIGLRDREVQKKLLSKKDLTLDNAFQTAQASDRAKSQVEVMSAEVHRMSVSTNYKHKSKVGDSYYRSQPQNKTRSASRPCFVCGALDHWKAQCPQLGQNKGKSSHKRTGQRYKKNHINRVNDNADSSESEDSDSFTNVVRLGRVDTQGVKSVRKVPEIMIEVTVNGCSLQMELDTGASVSLISHELYQKLELNTELKHTDIVLNTITGQRLDVIGKCKVQVEYKTQRYNNLILYVVESDGPPLLGRDWLMNIKIDWPSIRSLNVVTNDSQVENLKKGILSCLMVL